MLSGIANLLFGSPNARHDDVADDVTLTTCQADNEWLLVDRAESVPVPVEMCPLVLHLDDSIIELRTVQPSLRPVASRPGSAGQSRPRATVPSLAHASPSHQLGHILAPATAPQHTTWPRPLRGLARHSVDRTNRVQHHMSQCKQQRRYNYMLTHSSQRNTHRANVY
jgi:hypothetical protein